MKKLKNKNISLIIDYTIMATMVLIFKTLIRYGFDKEMFWDNFNKDIWIAIGLWVSIGIYTNYKTKE